MFFPHFDAQQQAAFDRISNWIMFGDGDMSLIGVAGSGKTTIITEVVSQFSDFLFVLAPTAKAAANLIAKNVQCRTVHSQCLARVSDDDDCPLYEPKINAKLASTAIVDEASMVCQEMFDAIRLNFKQVLWVGDAAQLGPVGVSAKVLERPDIPRIELETIHRQASGSAILDIATSLRTTGRYHLQFDQQSTFAKRAKDVRELADYAMKNDIDVTLCHSNKLRNAFNKTIRELKGYRIPIVDGERLVCLKNDYRRGIFNGQLLNPNEVRNGTYQGHRLRLPGSFGTDGIEVDYAYALTVYKSQGSEYERVLFVDHELPLQSAKQLRYTACTRAKTELHVGVIGGRR